MNGLILSAAAYRRLSRGYSRVLETVAPFEARSRVASAVIESKIYYFGGWVDSGDNYSDAFFSYDVTTKQFESLPNPYGKRAFSTLVAHNGLLYMYGGRNATARFSNVSRFNPVTKTWTERTSFPTAQRLMGSAATVLKDKIYITGGASDTGHFDGLMIHDIPKNTSTVYSLGSKGRRYGKAVTLDNNVYSIGGINSDIATIFPDVDIYSEAPQRQAGVPLPAGMERFGAAVVGNEIVIYGGIRSESGSAYRTADTQIYSPATNTWKVLPSSDTPIEQVTLDVVNGELYASFGWMLDEGRQNKIWKLVRQ